MKRWTFMLLACAAASPLLAQAAPPAVRTVTLENGMRVLLAPDPLAATVDVAVWYGAGTRVEREGTSGITHVMERLMFRGSTRYAPGEHQRLLRAESATFNSFTSPDVSCFYETVPPEALELALKLEADRMTGLKLTADGVARELRNVREEQRRLSGGNPIAAGLQRLYATAFAGHPYGWPAIGLERDLDRVTLATCQAYYRDRYGPNNAVLSLTGRFDPEAALGLARQAFAPLSRRAVPAGTTPPPAPQTAERRANGSAATPVPILLMGWRGPGADDAAIAALDVLSRILVSGRGSRLRRAMLSGPAPCLAVEGDFDSRRDASLLFAAAIPRPESDSAAVERALVAETEKLATVPVDLAELDHAKREAELALMVDWETPRGRARALGEAEAVQGDWRAVERRLQRLRELTPEDLSRVAAEVFAPQRRTVIWLHPGASSQTGGGAAGARPGAANGEVSR